MSLINISICLSDIPREKMKKAKNGKTYCNLVVAARREPSQYGETHTVYVSQDKDEREAKMEKVYVGGGKEFVAQNAPVTAEDIEAMEPINENEPDFL